MDDINNENFFEGHSLSWCEKCQTNHYASEICPKKSEIMKYEYFVTSEAQFRFGWDKNIVINLNKLGGEGWELCGVYCDLLYFKRKMN